MPIQVDAAFKALANEARLDIVTRLAYGPATTSALAEPLRMTLAGVTQHLQHLEAAELVLSTKHGRTRVYRLNTDTFDQLEQWLAARRSRWESSTARLESHFHNHEEGTTP